MISSPSWTAALRTDLFPLVPLNPSGLVDLVPAADPPPAPALELVVLRTVLQYPQSHFSGSKPASTPESQSPPTYAMHPCPGSPHNLLTSPRSIHNRRRNTCFLSHDMSRLQHLLLALIAPRLLSSFLTPFPDPVGTPPGFDASNSIFFCTRCYVSCYSGVDVVTISLPRLLYFTKSNALSPRCRNVKLTNVLVERIYI